MEIHRLPACRLLSAVAQLGTRSSRPCNITNITRIVEKYHRMGTLFCFLLGCGKGIDVVLQAAATNMAVRVCVQLECVVCVM